MSNYKLIIVGMLIFISASMHMIGLTVCAQLKEQNQLLERIADTLE